MNESVLSSAYATAGNATASARAHDNALRLAAGPRACIEVGQSHSLIAAMWIVAS
ncbi:hypothetical protein Mam01_58480 [Microbispora amethystogenes]|uniref:Uncharacterized protein n=1 Tax=Microbispora amethystogenes TaxID=1427754 RepID=A0ABQ4FLJ0_9ACTN|nr:hypothetical protein Mam01_58480 [Microbispora amethystogenes]